jgi:hypothetical protein
MASLKKLQKLVGLVEGESLTNLTRKELEQALSEVIDFIGTMNNSNRDEFSKVSKTLGQELGTIKQSLMADMRRYKDDLSQAAGIKIIEGFRSRLESIESKIQARLAELENGKDGISPEIEDVIKGIIPFIPKGSPDTGVEIRNKLEHLEGDERLSVEAIHGLDEKLRKMPKGGAGIVAHRLDQIIDVDLVTNQPTDGQALAYDATNNKWVPSNAGAGDVITVGTPANNQIAVWTGDGTIEGDSALTFDTTDDTVTIAASGNLKFGSATIIDDNAGTTTLSNIDAIDATTTTTISTAIGAVTKVGTPVNNQIGVWTGDGTLEGDASLTWDGTSFNIATAKNLQVAGATILADAAGTTTLSNIDALDATTEATIEGAIDTLANLTSIQGRTVTLADAGADAILGWDDSESAYENLTQAEVLAVIGDSSTTAKGVVEIAINTEVDTGTDATRAISPDALAGSTIFGRKTVSIQITEGATDVTTGDGKAYITIPEALNGMNLVRAQATVVTAGTTNATTVMIHNKTDAADMLSGAISIASAGTVGTVGTVNGSADDVATNDVLRVDVDSVSTTAPKGLMVVLEFQLP